MNNPGAPRKALGRGLEALLKPPGPLSPTPVSYTHLTLPTILRV